MQFATSSFAYAWWESDGQGGSKLPSEETAFVEERRLGKDVDDSGEYDAGKESDAEVWR